MEIIDKIRQAIQTKKPIEFEYDDGLTGTRIGNPHIIFMRTLKSGKISVYLHIWQSAGVSKSHVPDWKQHLIDKITNVKVLDLLPQFSIADGYNEEYELYEVVIEKVLR